MNLRMMKDGNKSKLITLSDGDTVKILFEDLATFALRSQPDDFQRLIRLQVDETYEPPVFHDWKIKGLWNQFLLFLMAKLSYMPAGVLAESYQKIMDYLFPQGWFFGWTRGKEFNWAWNDTQRLLDQNRFAVVKINDEIVSMGAYKLGGELDDQRPVFELTKFITIKRFRGKGLYRALRGELIQQIQDHFPDAPIMTFTKNKTVINRCRAKGWLSISLETYSDLTKRIGRTGLTSQDMFALRHWRGFLFDPMSGR